MKMTVLTAQQPCNKEMRNGKVVSCKNNGFYSFKNVTCKPSELLTSISNDPCKCWMPNGYCTVAEEGYIVPASYIVELGLAPDADACRGRAFEHEGRTLVTRQKENFTANGILLWDMDSGRWTLDQAKACLRAAFGDISMIIVASSKRRLGVQSENYHIFAYTPEVMPYKQRWLTWCQQYGYAYNNGRSVFTIFDQSVIDQSCRISYDGAPVDALHDAEIEVIHGTVDTDLNKLPVFDVELLKGALPDGTTVAANGTITDTGVLTLDTVIETKKDTMTVQQFIDSGVEKLRCQIPGHIRESKSWNGILRNTDSGVILHDNGTNTTYRLPPDAAAMFGDIAGGAEQAGAALAPAKKQKSKLFDSQNPLDWTGRFVMTQDQVDAISQPKWIYENLIIQGHLIAIPAPPNGGKTTILMGIAPEIVGKGYRVVYVNADISGTDAKMAYAQAIDGRFELLTPDFVMGDDGCGLSMSDVVALLEDMSGTDADYSSVVFVFDTLKKMVDVIQKSAAKELYKTLRKLTARGATIVCLGHTNKYPDAEGNLVYEGTGDLRADVDELIFLYPKKNDDGSMTVSTKPDKVRGAFKPITFTISADREVSRSSAHVDVQAQLIRDQQRQADLLEINAITALLSDGKQHTQGSIINAVKCKDGCRGRDAVYRVLSRYDGREWVGHRGATNSICYSLMFA